MLYFRCVALSLQKTSYASRLVDFMILISGIIEINLKVTTKI
jgi:hypothetical protein